MSDENKRTSKLSIHKYDMSGKRVMEQYKLGEDILQVFYTCSPDETNCRLPVCRDVSIRLKIRNTEISGSEACFLLYLIKEHDEYISTNRDLPGAACVGSNNSATGNNIREKFLLDYADCLTAKSNKGFRFSPAAAGYEFRQLLVGSEIVSIDTDYGRIDCVARATDNRAMAWIICQQIAAYAKQCGVELDFASTLTDCYKALCKALKARPNYVWSIFERLLSYPAQMTLLSGIPTRSDGSLISLDEKSAYLNKLFGTDSERQNEQLFRDIATGSTHLFENAMTSENTLLFLLTLSYFLFGKVELRNGQQPSEPKWQFAKGQRLSLRDSEMALPVAMQTHKWFKMCGALAQKIGTTGNINFTSDAAENAIVGLEHEITGDADPIRESDDTPGTTDLIWMLMAVLEYAMRNTIEISDPEQFILKSLSGSFYTTYKRQTYDLLHEMTGTLVPTEDFAEDVKNVFYDRSSSVLQKLYVFQSFGKEDENGARHTEEYKTIFDAFPNDPNQPVRLIISRKAGWGKTVTQKMLACCYSYENDRAWIRSEVEKNFGPGIHSEVISRSYSPVFIRVSDIAVPNRPFSGTREAFWEHYLKQAVIRLCEDNSGGENWYQDCYSMSDALFGEKDGPQYRPILIFDGLNDINPMPNMSVAETLRKFLQDLGTFLRNHPFCGCIISTLESVDFPEDLNFITVNPLSFTKSQIVNYCRKWFSFSGRKDESVDFVDRIINSYSVRRMVRRPVFMNYFMAVGSTCGMSPFYESSFSLLEKLIDNPKLLRKSYDARQNLSRCEKRDVILPLSLIGKEIQNSCGNQSRGKDCIHIPVQELHEMIRKAKEWTCDYISSDSLFSKEAEEISAFLRSLTFLKFDRAGSRKTEDEIFSFSSRPLMWYFAARGIVFMEELGIINGAEGGTALEYIKHNMEMRCKDSHIMYRDDWIYIVAYTVMLSGARGEQIMQYLCGCTVDASPENRNCRNVCVQIISKLIVLYPLCSKKLRELLYRSAFMRYFDSSQIGEAWGILRSPAREEFLNYVYSRFEATASTSFPQFQWLVGWLDWVAITSRLTADGRSHIASFLARVSMPPYIESLVSGSYQKKDIIMHLVNYIQEWYNNGAQFSADIVRAFLTLSNFFWLQAYNRRSYRIGRLDDEPMLEDEIICDNSILGECMHAFIPMLRLKVGCLANIAAYIMTHILKQLRQNHMSEIDNIFDSSVLPDIIAADHHSRVLYAAEKEGQNEAEVFEHDKKGYHPLDGALCLLNAIDAHMLSENALCETPELQQLREFYRKEWERYEQDNNVRCRIKMFRICTLLNIWDAKETAEKARTLLRAYRQSTEENNVFTEKDDAAKLIEMLTAYI